MSENLKDWERWESNRKRSKQILFHLNEEELYHLNEAVSKTLYNRSQYIRQVLFHNKITVVTRDIQVEELISKATTFIQHSKYISSNLNQITRVVNRRMLLNDLPETLKMLPEMLDETNKEMKLIKKEMFKLFEDYDF